MVPYNPKVSNPNSTAGVRNLTVRVTNPRVMVNPRVRVINPRVRALYHTAVMMSSWCHVMTPGYASQ